MVEDCFMYITTTGYYNTGSSAVTNIFQEFDFIGNTTDVYEVRLLHDPDCISDLYYNLVENPNRLNTSYAIKRFLSFVKYNSRRMTNHHYEKLCNGQFKKLSYEYISKISDFSYYGKSHLEMKDSGTLMTFLNRIYLKFIRIAFRSRSPRFIRTSLLRNVKLYAGTYDKERFLKATREYIKAILDYCNPSKNEYSIIDQLIPTTNVDRYLEFLPENCKVFIVDRDPRDLFISCKYFIKSTTVPCKDVKDFCKWFKWTRGQSFAQKNSGSFMRISFEDMIYDYENTRNKIINFVGIKDDNCSKKRQIFNPDKSINNTQTWYRYDDPKVKEEIEYIEQELKEYCYDFESKEIRPDFKGRMFNC